jgi:CRP-like cAMP-binding protein
MLLDALTDKEKDMVMATGAIREYSEGDLILREGDASTSLFMIIEGAVQVRKGLDQDRYKQLKDLVAGDFFGEMSFLTSTPRSADVLSVQDCRILEIPRDEFLALARKHPSIGMKVYRNIAEELATRLRRNNDDLKRAILWALEEMIS